MGLGLAILLAFGANQSACGQIQESYVVYRNGDRTEARGRITGRTAASAVEAAEVFQTVLDRLSAAGGGRLEIEPGHYLINRPIEIFSDITFSGAGKSSVLALGEVNALNEGVILRATGQDRIVIADLTLQGAESARASAGIILEAAGFATIRGVYAREFSGYGFWLRSNCFACKLENNYTSGNDQAGTFIDHTTKGRGGHFVPNKIIGCYSYAEDGNAFEFYRAICQDIVGCVSHFAKGAGIRMRKSTSNLINGNRIFMGQSHGIWIQDTFEMNVSGNICGWNWGDNLVLDHCVWGTVTGNEFIDAGGREREGYGIYMKRGTKSVQITGNAIFNWWDNQAMTGGIYEGDDCWENQITDNVINYYREFDVKSLGKDSVAAFNLGLPHPYGAPVKGPAVPNVKPEDIRLQMHINESRAMAEAYLRKIPRGEGEAGADPP